MSGDKPRLCDWCDEPVAETASLCPKHSRVVHAHRLATGNHHAISAEAKERQRLATEWPQSERGDLAGAWDERTAHVEMASWPAEEREYVLARWKRWDARRKARKG